MTLPDLPERQGEPSDTRQFVERGRTESTEAMSGRTFVIALVVIAAAIVALALVLR